MRIRLLIITALFLLASVNALAQQQPIIFSRVTRADGLASNMTFQSLRDKQGFLWIATQNGLQRYDHNRFLTFRHIPGNAGTIPENSVSRLYLDRKDRLWVAFDTKIGLFDRNTLIFQGLPIDTPINIIKKITEDPQGRLLLFADSKVLVFDELTHRFHAPYPMSPTPAGYQFGDMVPIPGTDKFWVTGKSGSMIYDPSTREYATQEDNKNKFIALDSLGKIRNARYPFIDRDGNWWLVDWMPFVGPAPILYRYDKGKNRLQRFEKIRAYKADSYYEIWNVFQQSNGTIWIYGIGLLAYYDKSEQRFIHINSGPFQRNGIDYDMVSHLQEDEEHNVWVSTNKGLYRFNTEAQVFRNLQNLAPGDTAAVHNAVSRILQTRQHGIWVSTWGAGVFSYDEALRPIANPIRAADPVNASLHASAMMERSNGEVWVGLQTGGIKVFDPAANRVYGFQHSLLKGEIIQQLFEDREGNTWIGTSSGLLLKCMASNWRDSLQAFETILSETSDIFKIYQDQKGKIWICTSATGIYEIDGSSGKTLRQFKQAVGKDDGLLNDGASDIVQYDDSTYLIASDGLCIFNARTNKFRYLTAIDGLPAEHITGLIFDKQHRLWVACDGGLYRLSIANNLYVSYAAEDGITNDVFQVASGTVLRDGRVAIGTPRNFLVFDPEATILKRKVPPVTITGLTLNGRSLLVDSIAKLGTLELSHDQTFLNIELSTLSFRDQYYMYYKLEGLDGDWKRVSNTSITYQYLPPGSYTLKLKSQNGDGAESESITSLQIRVNPPFWKTWWFYGLLVLLAGGIIFWLDQQRIRRKTAMLEMRSTIADGLHHDISETLGNITILSEMARIKAEKEPERSKVFIEQIHTKSQNMSTAMEDILWSIDPRNDSMENFLLRFREYIDAMKSQHQVSIDMLVDKQALGLKLKMEKRSDIFALFKGGINTTVRTGGDNFRIHISCEKGYLAYVLEFDTSKSDMVQLHNLRQRNELQERLQRLGAELIFRERGTQAEFDVRIPV